LQKPIIEKESIHIDNIFYFIRFVFKKYYKSTIILIVLFLSYKLISTPKYSSSISFYTNYEKTNQMPSSLGFITRLTGSKDNQLGFSISDYINSEGFIKDILEKKYNIEGEKIRLTDHYGENYDRLFSINPLSTIKKMNRNFMLVGSLSDEDKKFLFAKEVLLGSISYSEDRDTSLHKITIESSKFPSLSKQITMSVFQSIINYSNKVTNIKGREKREFIEDRLLSVKVDLESAENKLQSFLENNKALNSPALILQSERLERSITLYAQLYLSLSDQLEIAKIDEKDFTSSIFLLDNATLSFYKSERSLLNSIMLLLGFVFITASAWELYRDRERLFL